MILDTALITAMLDAQDRRWAGYRVRGTLLQEALELLYWGDIAGWTARRKHVKGARP